MNSYQEENPHPEILREEIMPVIKKIRKIMLDSSEKRVAYGFTLVTLHGYSLKVEHTGKMGNTLASVDENLLRLKLPTTSELKRFFKVEREDGSADYYYILQVRIRQSEKITIFPNTLK